MRKRRIPRPDRIRNIPESFAWVDHRLRRDGHLAELTPFDITVYFFLVLAADAQGISYYRLETISRFLGHLPWAKIHSARERLIERGLIAFEPFSPGEPNGFYQVLSLDGLEVRGFRDER